jgi:hypothetical protein
MAKGYAEGPAAEEAERRRDELFASGKAWGLNVVRVSADLT